MPNIFKGTADQIESTLNKVTVIDNDVTDDQYPSAKAVYDELGNKANKDELVGKKIEQGGETFNDYENNQANTLYSHAEGNNTVAGAKVFWAESGSAENKTYTLDSVEGIEVGDYYSYKCVPNEEAGITYNGTFDFCGTITAINGNTVTVSIFITGQNSAFQSGYFWIPRKPTIGTIIPELELWQHTEGSNTRAIMGAGHAEGNNTVASGRWSHAEGKGTIAGYGSHAEGRGTEARGLDSHSEGFHTVAQGEGAHAEGDHTVARGDGAHAEGIGKTSNVADTFAGGMRPDESYGALANGTHVEGTETKATKTNAHAEGLRSKAEGHASHAEGEQTVAGSRGAHAEGFNTTALQDSAHSEGHATSSNGMGAHSEGISTIASNKGAHSEGNSTQATAENAHAEGGSTVASGGNAHAEGIRTEAKATGAHSEGADTIAEGQRSHTEGNVTYAKGFASHAEGGGDSTVGASHKQTNFGAFGDFSHSEGVKTKAVGTASHSEGILTTAMGEYSHAEGSETSADGKYSHVEGRKAIAQGDISHAEGYNTRAEERAAHSEGDNTRAVERAAHSEGANTIANGYAAHAEGEQTKTVGRGAHAEGFNTEAKQDSAHAEGRATHAYGIGAHSEGFGSVAEAKGAHAEGINTIAHIEGSHAQGKYNKITKDTLTNVSLDGVIRAEATNYIFKTDGGIEWSLNTDSGANHYCFSYPEFSVGEEYKLRLTLNASKAAATTLNFYAWEDLNAVADATQTVRNRVDLAVNKSISLVKGENIVNATVTLETYPYLAMRFYNNSAIDAEVTLTKLEIVDEEIDDTIISSIGNGFDEDNRSNAFTAYKDGHAEVGKTGDTDNSVATKEYVDKAFAELQPKVLHGTESPSPNIGVDGDIYIQIINNEGVI